MWMSDVASMHGEVGGHDKFYLKKKSAKNLLIIYKVYTFAALKI